MTTGISFTLNNPFDSGTLTAFLVISSINVNNPSMINLQCSAWASENAYTNGFPTIWNPSFQMPSDPANAYGFSDFYNYLLTLPEFSGGSLVSI